MNSFKPDKNAIKKLEQQAQQAGKAAVDRATERGAGKPRAEAEWILREELKRSGITLGKDLRQIAEKIAGR